MAAKIPSGSTTRRVVPAVAINTHRGLSGLMPAAPVAVAFACPACMAPQEVGLIALSRAGFHRCTGCSRSLKAAVVSQAIHSGPPIRAPRAPIRYDDLPGSRTRLLR